MSLHVRYFALNVGAATGPILGTFAGISGHQTTFFLLAGIYAAYLLAAAIVFRIERPLKRSTMASGTGFGQILSVLGRDRALLLFVVAALLGNMAYAQIDAGMVQYLRLSNTPELTATIAVLIFTNAATVVAFQFPMLRLTRRLNANNRASIGVVLIALGLLGFALVPVHTLVALVAAMFVLSVGELILFPTINIIVDQIAPPDLKGSYVGAAQLASFGLILAPIAGGALLQWGGGLALWLTMAGLALLVALLFGMGGRAQATGVN